MAKWSCVVICSLVTIGLFYSKLMLELDRASARNWRMNSAMYKIPCSSPEAWKPVPTIDVRFHVSGKGNFVALVADIVEFAQAEPLDSDKDDRFMVVIQMQSRWEEREAINFVQRAIKYHGFQINRTEKIVTSEY